MSNIERTLLIMSKVSNSFGEQNFFNSFSMAMEFGSSSGRSQANSEASFLEKSRMVFCNSIYFINMANCLFCACLHLVSSKLKGAICGTKGSNFSRWFRK